MKKIINITHNDLDGVGCSIVLATMLHCNIESYYCGYHDIEDVLREVFAKLDDSVKAIYITDISMREGSKSYDKITEINKTYGYNFIRMIDHHATSKFVNKYAWATSYELGHISKKKECATYQLFRLLKKEGYSYSESLEKFVELVNLWDTWRWVTDYSVDAPYIEASQLNMVYSIYGRSKFFTTYISKIDNNSSMFEYPEQIVILCKEHEIKRDISNKDRELIVVDFTYHYKKSLDTFVKSYLANNHITDKNYLLKPNYRKQFKVGVVFTTQNVSDVGNGLADLHPELDFIMLVSLPNTVSFRSKKELEVPLGIVAKYITGMGGGHPQSAGGCLSKKLSYSLVSEILKDN